ncbi:MAG: flagellar biosynthesis anti-sigma factor FlgM [Sphaerobacter sp.]|nr:flagellar biosynthesis anti-sigma factor FlgM [Sphaerobacter sp.]
MIDPIRTTKARDAYVGRTGEAQRTHRSESERAARAAESTQPGDTDSVHLSEELRHIQRAVDIVRQSPEVRADRVAALRQRIEAGDYHVAPEQVAAKLLGIDDGSAA